MRRLLLCLLMAVPGMMLEYPHIVKAEPAATLNSDHYLHSHFNKFAKSRVDMLNRNYAGTKESPRLKHTENGVVGKYSKAKKDSLTVQVRRTQSELSPFIGVMKYTEVRYKGSGDCSNSITSESFERVRTRSVTEIFRFVQDDWQ
ncbi:hypothetical protein Dthio_PD2001 [Desulfonatronospira thiodismutans ASO3-1]|uniref:Uncharacterized protein n=1 Tax=Desulfonatronospira thiodismutans ASO3-1 TaxID=555779 RepID=D6SPF3_9BACT|nr:MULTISPECIES: hypothetical protein [Desulfonatronospira]EFI34629.1 hypothetical protein Dthio_PD2001 [Desulfonatronospira thiodismutans ASO3-1]RQD79544.1 MAG: hypothetical protein D5S03_00210 [Desulfonatronospira sp. MSAO_Bac3]